MQPKALAQLAKWGIAALDAERAGIFDTEDASSVYPDFRPMPAIVLPYYDASGAPSTFTRDDKPLPFCRVRYLERVTNGYGKEVRYSQPKQSGLKAYFPPIVPWADILQDPTEPLILTEGEAKSLSGVLAGFPVVAFGGVYNWAVDGELLPELAAISWRGRDVYIVFDSDAVTNPNVLAAEARLVDELQRKRGAKCFLVRLPQEGDQKIGLDDYLQAHGPGALMKLLQQAPSLGALDAKVVSLNRSCAWIERESLIYDLEQRLFVTKDAFVSGSRFSSIEHITVGGKQRSEPKRLSVAKAWLTHPHAQRFSEVLFRPGEGATVQGEHGRVALNLWESWDAEPTPATDRRVAAFLMLSRFLFQNLKPEDRDLPVKLLAYKAQHPAEKVPLALVLIGQQGCGKTLWGECVRDAFAPYGADVTPKSLAGEFQGWLERSLFALINEAKGEDMLQASEQLKALISDLRRPMNEKYRPVREINSYTMYCITSNRRAVGSFAADDRRMIVVDCPNKMTDAAGEALYTYLGRRAGSWHSDGGPKALLGYLLSLDLQGWVPPSSAPMTAEKYLAYIEALTPVQRLAEEMRHAKFDEHCIKRWLDASTQWAREHELSSNTAVARAARGTLEGVKFYQIRPWYTPEELTMMFPNLVETVTGSKYDQTTPAGKVSRELRDAGVPYLVCADDPRGFKWRGAIRQYLVVCDFEDWRAPLAQADFERLMKNWPAYGQMGRRQ